MTLSAEAIDRMEGLAQRAATPEVVKLDRRTVLVRGSDGGVEEHPLPWPKRHATLEGLADVIRVCADEKIAPKPEVYHGKNGIDVVLNLEEREEIYRMSLEPTARFQRLMELERDRTPMDPKEVNRLLRFDLHGTGVDAAMRALSKIEFGRTSTGSATLGHGKESLGRSVEAAVQKADEVPEHFFVETPVYTNDGVFQITKVKVRCGVDLDLDNMKITVAPLADELANALNVAHRAIGDALRDSLEEGITVLAGEPSF